MFDLSLSALAKRVFQNPELTSKRSNMNRTSGSSRINLGGLIINTHGWIFDYGYQCTIDAIRKFSVTHICVLGDYRLYEKMSKDFGRKPNNKKDDDSINVLYYPRNFSTVKRSTKLRFD